MSSGYSGGGGPEFYSDSFGGVQPRSSPLTSDPPPVYLRTPQQFRGIILDSNSSTQIERQSPSPSPSPSPLGLIGKRTLSEFQNHATLNNLLLRSVRSRQASVLSNLASYEYPGSISLQRYGAHLLQQQKPRPMNPIANQIRFESISIPNLETENMLMSRLHELEKQLLDDDAADGASVVTNTNSEWSENIQSLINPTPNPIASSPSSSSSSSPSSSTSVASPVSVSLKQSLIEAATAIYDGRSDLSGEMLVRLSASSNPKGNTEQRLVNYVLSALKSRVNAVENPPPVADLSSREHVQSTQLLYDMNPCFKLGFLAANFAILEAALEPPVASQLHVVDFDIGEGGQYQNLLHALSTQQASKPPVLKITAVTDGRAVASAEHLRSVREKLIHSASTVGIHLRFNVVVSPTSNELSRESLGCDSDEALAVNLAFKLSRMPDESVSVDNPRDALLRRVKHLSPRVVTLVEQEWNANTAPFLMRVNEALSYYGALLDSIDLTVSKDSRARVLIESELSRKVVNSIACEGPDRVERCEVFGKWRSRMGMAGFQLRPMSSSVVESMKTRLSSGNRVNPGFTVKGEDGGGVGFGWLGRTLTVASAWR